MENAVFWLIIAFIGIEFLLDQWLDLLNARSWKTEVPEELKDVYQAEEYKKAQLYEKENKRLGNIAGLLSFAAILTLLFVDGFGALNDYVTGKSDNAILQGLMFYGVLMLASEVLRLPFSVYKIFVIEERYGFNRMTPGLFVADKLKGYLLTAFIGGGLLAGFIYFYLLAGSWFWIYAWLMFTLFSLVLTMFYTTLFVPLFNKLKPLPEGALRERIESFSSTVGFPLQNILVIDGSKRSTKANAFFSGIGKKKSIVLYDTLIEDHTDDELVGVLAHEIGHYKLDHIRQSLFISIMNSGLVLFLLSVFIDSPALAGALGVDVPNFHIGLLAFGLLYSPISLFTGLLSNIFSRRNEYAADNYAKEHFRPEPLISALKKLSAKHLSNLQPHPLYVFFHYSHPPLLERLRNLRS